MKPNYAQLILQDEEARELLKSMICDKFKRYEEIEALKEKFLKSGKGKDEFNDWFFERVFDVLFEGRELSQIEKDLAAMCFELRRVEGKIAEQTEWDEKYEHATNQVRIGDVVRCFLGVDNFRRNISCPLHKDKKPSFKIYEKDNRFVCFSCGACGSPIDFVMLYKNCSFKEAVSILSNL